MLYTQHTFKNGRAIKLISRSFRKLVGLIISQNCELRSETTGASLSAETFYCKKNEVVILQPSLLSRLPDLIPSKHPIILVCCKVRRKTVNYTHTRKAVKKENWVSHVVRKD